MKKEEILELIKSGELFSANRLYLNETEICDWQADHHSLLELCFDYNHTRDEYWLNEIETFRVNAKNKLASMLFDLSLSQKITYFCSDTHCKIGTSPLQKGEETNIDADVVQAMLDGFDVALENAKTSWIQDEVYSDRSIKEKFYRKYR